MKLELNLDYLNRKLSFDDVEKIITQLDCSDWHLPNIEEIILLKEI